MYAPNNRAVKTDKTAETELIKLKGGIDRSTIIAGDVKHLSTIHRITR